MSALRRQLPPYVSRPLLSAMRPHVNIPAASRRGEAGRKPQLVQDVDEIRRDCNLPPPTALSGLLRPAPALSSAFARHQVVRMRVRWLSGGENVDDHPEAVSDDAARVQHLPCQGKQVAIRESLGSH